MSIACHGIIKKNYGLSKKETLSRCVQNKPWNEIFAAVGLATTAFSLFTAYSTWQSNQSFLQEHFTSSRPGDGV
jgi:hypothetical protein